MNLLHVILINQPPNVSSGAFKITGQTVPRDTLGTNPSSFRFGTEKQSNIVSSQGEHGMGANQRVRHGICNVPLYEQIRFRMARHVVDRNYVCTAMHAPTG